MVSLLPDRFVSSVAIFCYVLSFSTEVSSSSDSAESFAKIFTMTHIDNIHKNMAILIIPIIPVGEFHIIGVFGCIFRLTSDMH